MVKPALAATRAAAVLDYLSMRPGRPCTLTEIAGALRVSPASMLAVLAALTDAGYLVRHSAHKTYVVGPAVVALGRALAVVRARGYAVNRDGDARERLGVALTALGDEPADDRLRREVDSLIALHTEDFLVLNLDQVDAPSDISHVTVPVFGPEDEAAMILTSGGFAPPLGGAEVEAVADRLKASAEAIALEAFGRATACRAPDRAGRRSETADVAARSRSAAGGPRPYPVSPRVLKESPCSS
jgi:IclR helix-turn-helix domain